MQILVFVLTSQLVFGGDIPLIIWDDRKGVRTKADFNTITDDRMGRSLAGGWLLRALLEKACRMGHGKSRCLGRQCIVCAA